MRKYLSGICTEENGFWEFVDMYVISNHTLIKPSDPDFNIEGRWYNRIMGVGY
jgi:hypothetical protein